MAITLPVLLSLLASTTPGGEEPFPVDKTVTLKQAGVLYTVEGRQRIPDHVKISSLRNMRLVGKGDGAVLEVGGALEFKAVTGGAVVIEDLWIEVAPECKSLSFSHVEFKSGSGVRSPEEAPNRAKIFLEYVKFAGGAFSIDMTAGSLDVQASHSRAPLVIRGVAPSESSSNDLKVLIMGCAGPDGGLAGGLELTGVDDALVRNNDIGGVRTLFQDCRDVMFDGNNARSKTTEFRQSAHGQFGKIKIKNTDVRSDKLVLFAPVKGKKLERVQIDNCWFGGPEDPETIRSTIVEDSLQNPESGILATFKKTSTEPIGFGGKTR